MNKKFAIQIASPLIGAAVLASLAITSVFAWPTRGPIADCKGIHWEMQNDTKSTHNFTGKITSPIQYTVNSTVKPNEWGVLDKQFSNLNGTVTVTASISMGGDTRNFTKTLNCTQPSPTPSPTPSASPSPTPTPTPSATPNPSPTPTPNPSATPSPTPSASPSPAASPTPSPCTENCGGITITNNNNNTNNNVNNNNVQASSVSVPVKQPETGAGAVAVATMAGAGPLGFALSKFKKGKGLKEEESIEEFAQDAFNSRIKDLS